MWYDSAVLYQIYPLGAFGAPFENDGIMKHRILNCKNYIEDLEKLGIDCILLNPIFMSTTHGYDTNDYKVVDNRLGTNEDLKELIQALHKHSIRIMFDAVFNHCGRGFFAFQDVLKNKENSKYKDWFNINFYDNNNYNDGFSYQNWEGNNNLVKFNLKNWDVRHYLLDIVEWWMKEFEIDGIRLDVAYLLDREFLTWLRGRCKWLNPDFFLLGETLHGDYNLIMNDQMLDSVTNYEAYKGIYSSFNTGNFFEILYSFNRQFGKDPWCLYTGKHLVNFLDNHDVVRIASILDNKKHLPLVYAMLFTMPGIPCIYYGSEWGLEGKKNWNDTELRPYIEKLQSNELTEFITQLIQIKHKHTSLHIGDYTQIYLNNKTCAYQRSNQQDTIIVCINIDDHEVIIPNMKGKYIDLITNQSIDFDGKMKVNSVRILQKI